MTCIQLNGDLTGYSLKYGVEESGRNQTMSILIGATTETIVGLDAATPYFIEIAAVNKAGIGIYSSALVVITKSMFKFYTIINVSFVTTGCENCDDLHVSNYNYCSLQYTAESCSV